MINQARREHPAPGMVNQALRCSTPGVVNQGPRHSAPGMQELDQRRYAVNGGERHQSVMFELEIRSFHSQAANDGERY